MIEGLYNCRKCERRVYKEREKKRFKCDSCYKGEQESMGKFLPGVERLKPITKPGFCIKCKRLLKKKMDIKTRTCEFCRERKQEHINKFVRVKKRV